jgi:hypothetical protein
MTTLSFEALGISKEDLTEKLLDRLIEEFTTEVTWDEDAKPAEISMTVRFDNAILFDHNGNRMGTFSHSPEIDGRIGDFSTGIGGNN